MNRMSDQRIENPDELHALLDAGLVWTDESWTAAMAFLAEHLSSSDLQAIAACVDGDDVRDLNPGESVARYLSIFQTYPTTVLIGAYDLTRHRRHIRREMEWLAAS